MRAVWRLGRSILGHCGAAFLCAGLVAPGAARGQAPERPSGWINKAPVTAQRYMVAAAHPLAADAGEMMLRAGGSAVDAAIAVQLVLNLVEPQSSGIGGGAFLLHHEAKSGRLLAYDGRETAPATARPERFVDSDGHPLRFADAVVGGRSVGVPGTLRLLELAHRRHGRLPWAQLFEPAINLAENGFSISERLAGAVARDAYLAREPVARAYFYDAAGRPRAAGSVLRNPEFAAVLRRVAGEGADAFYHGEIARDIVAAVRGHSVNPGDLDERDLAGYRAKVRAPICGAYRRYRVCGMPPPSSGGIGVLQMLGLLERFELRSVRPDSFFAAHLFSEAGRLAYADRNRYVADPDFVPVVAGLTDPEYLAQRSGLIRIGESMGVAPPGEPRGKGWTTAFAEGDALEFPSTSHVSIVDGWGNAVALTTTIEDGFGSRLMVHGFLLNNELTDFSFVPTRGGQLIANRVEGGKRPRSSMAPTIVYDRAGRIKLISGSPGGSAIINYVAKSVIGVLDWQLDPQAAIDLPNFGSRNGPTELERGSRAEKLAAKLRAIGHEVKVVDFNSGLHMIMRRGQHWIGGADPRREGVVRGQ